MSDPHIFISVAEDSADVHAASLVLAARRRWPGVAFRGLTGARLRALGVQTIADLASHAAMLGGAIKLIARARRAVRAVENAWDARRPDVVVLIDSPELHLPLAARARRRGLAVLYYVAPQTWASRAGRNRRIWRDVDRLACILPFEEAYFRGVGVAAEYVGHPLFEALARERANAQTVARLRDGLSGPLVALLPGSRRGVISAMLPRQLEVVRQLREAGVALRAAVSCVDARRYELVRSLARAAAGATNVMIAGSVAEEEMPAVLGHDLERQRTERPASNAVPIVIGDNASLLSAADLVLVASGTATLEVAHYRKPMIVMYHAGPVFGGLHGMLGRYFLSTPHLSLVNILAGNRVVPELMPYLPDVAPATRMAAQLLRDEAWRGLMAAQLDEVVRPLEDSRASERVCEMIGELMQHRGGGDTSGGREAGERISGGQASGLSPQ